MRIVEFWPDYGAGPLWAENGEGIDGLYVEDKVPLEGPGEADWLSQGKRLLAELRDEIGARCEVTVTEPWWGEQPS